MTRLLFPEAFGLMAFVTTILVGLHLVSDVGIGIVIVQNSKGEEQDFLRSAWTVQIARGLLIGGSLVFAAVGLIWLEHQGLLRQNSTLADAKLPGLIAATAIIPALSGFESVNTHLNLRRLNLRPLVIRDLASKLFSIPVMVTWAWLDRSVWALFAGQVAAALWYAGSSHIFLPGPQMGLVWDKVLMRQLLDSGKWIALSSASTFFSKQGDKLILAALLPSTTLGIYSVAFLLKEGFEGVLARLHSTLTMPMLGETLREQPQAFCERYYRFRAPIEAVAFFVGGALMVSGNGIVALLYDQRYHDAGWMLQLLAFSLITYPIQMIGSAFFASGEMNKGAIISVINAVSILTLIWVGYVLAGLPGVVLGVALSRIPSSIVALIFAHKRGWISPLAELRYVPLVGLGMVAGLAALWVLRFFGLLT